MQSSAAVVTMTSQNRKRAPAWTDREVLDLIAVWGDESVLSELPSKRRNAKIYEKISKAMVERGYVRDATQCRVKIKELRQAYQKTKESNGCSGSQPHTCRFSEALHAMLGGAATTTPPVSVDSDDGVLSTATSSEIFADGEEEEGEEEEEAVDSAFTADFPDSQDLFITLTEIPYAGPGPRQRIVREVTSSQMDFVADAEVPKTECLLAESRRACSPLPVDVEHRGRIVRQVSHHLARQALGAARGLQHRDVLLDLKPGVALDYPVVKVRVDLDTLTLENQAQSDPGSSLALLGTTTNNAYGVKQTSKSSLICIPESSMNGRCV
ncbi:uncharacterized protein RBU57_002204 [Macrochelys suwanniensis]